ncbi:diaminopimelate decarboxylase [uncultured Clostridium sp.]|jgi:diaminopimelate decarboxylase|uniref:diaminopimelate decarboxylase n=1 Tax=uncultured Clostridium sp. TaxID=59620 RepID=UPI002634FB77|nr:diaminopimelate decarboxylase [uncultured Clostridium sp.]
MKMFGAMKVENNELYIGGVSCTELAKTHGTPLYVMDEELVRNNCRDFFNNFKCEARNNRVVYAGKACMTMAMCKIAEEEGLCLDVVSGGELYTAYKSGFPMEKIYFHGNNKTVEEINMGLEYGIGRFMVDNHNELYNIDRIARDKGMVQKIYIRITPGIEAHTHDYIKTGQLDSKFGFPVIGDDIITLMNEVKELKNVELVGLHCHIGSQIFDLEPFEDAAEVMLNLMDNIYRECGIRIHELDLGGGFGVYYTSEDNPRTTKEYCEAILNKVEEVCERLSYPLPLLSIEPGRSLVANAGTSLYEIGAVKTIEGVRTYASTDGGMSDNIRTALYGAKYECCTASRMEGENQVVTIAGKCCESGDVLVNDANITKLETGDILAMMTTGAYGYSMASNYNRMPRPAVVMVQNGLSRVVCKKESFDDMIKNECI